MLRIRLFFIISIFLCVPFFASAQDWELMAVGYERQIYDGAGLQETNAALLAKSECYKMLGRYKDASATLDRIRMFALTDEERTEVQYQQELCHFLNGDFGQAAVIADNLEASSRDILLLHALVLAYSGRYDESEIMAARCISWNGPSPYLNDLLDLYRQRSPERSAPMSMVLSFFPPVGHFYNEEYGEGLLSGGLNATSLAFLVANLVSGYWITGLLGGAIALNYTYMGNIERCLELTEIHNNNARILFGDRLREFLANVLEDMPQ